MAPVKETRRKAKDILRVFKSTVSAGLLVGWSQLIIATHLKTETEIMSQMDPGEIIAIPYTLQRLNVFVMLPVVVIVIINLVQTPETFTSFLLALGRLTMIVYAVLGVCGSHIVENYQHSILAAIYVASLLSTTSDTSKMTTFSNVLDQLPFKDTTDILATGRLYGTICIIIPFQALQVLDKGSQLQRWPLPIVLGATYGWVVGNLFGIMLTSMRKRHAVARKQMERRTM